MPRRRVPEIGGVVKHRDANGVAVDLTSVKYPLGLFPPQVLAGHAFTVNGVSKNVFNPGFRVGSQAEIWMRADREQSFFGVLEVKVTMGRPKVDQAIYPATGWVATKPIGRLVGQQRFTVN